MIEKSRFRGGIYGLLLGDAAGVPYEFRPPGDLGPIADRVDLAPPAGWRSTYAVPPGTWSDDGALALCLLESLVQAGGFDLADQARRMVAWLDRGHLAVDGVVFDVGITTREALGRARAALARGLDPAGSGLDHEQSAGNGTLMRILPLALWHDGGEEELARMATAHSGLTHAHPLCRAACVVYCLWARDLAAGAADPFDAALGRARGLLGADPGLDDAFGTLGAWRDRPPGGTGFVVDTLFSARHALEGAGDFEAVVRRAILLGHDTDTTAAVAGGLAGVKFGAAGLPDAWLARLRGRDLVEPILARAGA